MGHFNEILASRYPRALAALLRMQEQEGARTLSPDFHVGMELEHERPEYSYLKREGLLTGHFTAAAVAGQFSFCLIENPTNSEALVVIQAAFAQSANATAVYSSQVGRSAVIPGGFSSNNVPRRDTRWWGPTGVTGQIGAARLRAGAAAAPLGLVLVEDYASAANQEIPSFAPPVILHPGHWFGLMHASVNALVRCGFRLYERPVGPEELDV